jgi:hypothetical protein
MIVRMVSSPLLMLLLAAPLLAQVDPFEFEVYPSQTEGKGVAEVELLNGYVPQGHREAESGTSSGEFASDQAYRTALEVAYGLTNKLEAAAYLNLARPNGASFQYAGSKFRLRGSLFEQGELPVDLGGYVELEWHKTPQFDDSELELEIKPIIEKDIGRFEIDLNPIFEKAVFTGPDKNKGFEFGYASGLYYNYRRWLSPGIEWYGEIGLIDDTDPLSEQQHYLFPVIRGRFAGGLGYSFGPGIGLTRGSDQVLMKLNLELEHFVGSLF